MTTQEAGWYWAEGDPEGTKRYWTGEAWAPGIVGLEPWRRAGAKIIDLALMLVFALLLGLIFGGGVGSTYLLTLLTLIVAAGAQLFHVMPVRRRRLGGRHRLCLQNTY